MMRSRIVLNSFAASRTRMRALLAVGLAAFAWGCADKIVGPDFEVPRPKGRVGVYADVGPTGITTLVIQASGPGIVKSNGLADTLSFNIPLVNGVASGSVDIPAGPDRVITARAFIGIAETHRGSVTATILEGANPTIQITLAPLVGNLPITVSIGSTIVVVRPIAASLAVGDTLRLTAEVRDQNGSIIAGPVRWATLNPLKAAVDTFGLVTMRDTGDVQVVATYGTVGGASKLTGNTRLADKPYQLTWNGSVNTKWSEPNNWTPVGIGAARVPTLTDSVVIPAAVSRWPTLDTCVDNNTARDLIIELGASLSTVCYPINVYGAAIVQGNLVAQINLRPNGRIAGRFGEVNVVGDGVRMLDSVRATNFTVTIPTGTFTMDGHTLRTGNFTVNDGTVTMADGDTLIINGNTNWNGDDQPGLITGGVVYQRGDQFSGTRFYASGTNRLVFDRTTANMQYLFGFDYVNSFGRSQINRLDIRNRDGVHVCAHVRVADTTLITSTGTPLAIDAACGGYQLRADGPVITSAGTDVASYLWELRHATGTSLIGGTWHPTNTEFRAVDAIVKPTLTYNNVGFFASNQLIDNINATGALMVDGSATTLALNGRKAVFALAAIMRNGGLLRMTSAADSLIVGENVGFEGDTHLAQKIEMTAGVLSVGAYFDGFGFGAQGTFKVVLAGTSASTSKYITRVNYSTRPQQSIPNLEVAVGKTYGLCEFVKVVNTVVVKAGATLGQTCTNSNTLQVLGDLVGEPGSTITPYQLILANPTGTSNVAGAFTAVFTDFMLADAPVKAGLNYQSLGFYASNHLLGATTATGRVWVDGGGTDLTVSGQTLTVGDYMQMQNGGMLTMNNAADVVNVANYATFNWDGSTVQRPKLTAGRLRVGGYFDGFGFSASGTHTVELTGTFVSTQRYITRVNYASRPQQSFANLEITSGATYGLCENVRVTQTLLVRTGATLGEWCGNSNVLQTTGDLIGEAGSTITPYVMSVANPTGTSNVAGTFSPEFTDFTLADAPVKAGLSYKNLAFYASNHLLGTTSATKRLLLEGAGTDLALNGQTMSVGDYMLLNTGATLTMNNAADILNVTNYVSFSWDGSVTENTRLTAGIMRVGGYFDGFGFSASGTHRVELLGTYPNTQRYITRVNYSSRAAQAFQDLTIVSGGSYGLCEFVAVKGTMTVASGGTLQEWCGNSNHLRIDGNLVSAAGSTINPYEVVLNNTVGTQNVLGGFSPQFTSLATTAAAGQLKTGLGYQNVTLLAPASLGANMTVNGDMLLTGPAAVLTLNGKQLSVTGTFNVQSNATVVMSNPADVLELIGNVSWSGGGSEAGKLTAGTTIARGLTFCATNYETGGTHKTVFDRSGTPVRLQCVSSNGISQPMYDVEVKNAGLALECYMNVTHDIAVRSGASLLIQNCGTGTMWVAGTLSSEAGSTITNGPSYPSSQQLSVVLSNATGTQSVAGAFNPHATYFTGLNAFINPALDYRYVRIDQSTTFQGPTEIDAQLDIIGTSIVALGGNTVTVKGTVNFDNTAKLKMINALDTLVVGAADPTADLLWDGGDNSTDGTGPLLTNGAIKFHGDRFYGLQYSAKAGSPHRFIFMAGGAGPNVSLEGGPAFAQMEIRGTRPVVNNTAMLVQDSLMMGPSTVFGAVSGTVQLMGAVVTAAASDISGTTVFLDGPNGTRDVLGRFRPTSTLFRSVVPVAAAIRKGLEYNNVVVQGPYQLNDSTTFAGNLDVNGANASLAFNNKRLAAARVDMLNGGALLMTNALDSLVTPGLIQFQGSAGTSILSAGVMVLGGNFNNSKDGIEGSGTHKVVLVGSGTGQTINTATNGLRSFQNLEIAGSPRTVNFSSGIIADGTFSITQPVNVTGGNSTLNGPFLTVAGSSFTHSTLDVYGATGTSNVDGALNITSIMRFRTGPQVIRTGASITYANVEVYGAGTVSGGPLSVAGYVNLPSATATLTVPTGSLMGSMDTFGTVIFTGSATSNGTLLVRGGGSAAATDLSAAVFVDFRTIQVLTGGTLDNGSRLSGLGGFRFLTVGGSYSNAGSLIGTAAPVGH